MFDSVFNKSLYVAMQAAKRDGGSEMNHNRQPLASMSYDPMPDNLRSTPMSNEDILALSEKAIKEYTCDRLSPFVENRFTSEAVDAFASFLSSAGTLSAPSLIVRCRIQGPEFTIDLIVDKPISRWRLSDCFVPFLSRVLRGFRGQAEFLILISDNLYPTPHSLPRLAEHLRSVPLLRCDRNDDKPDSCHTILIPDFYLQQTSYSEVFEQIRNVQARHPFSHRENKVMWRGSLSGPTYVTLENVETFPRFKLLELSRAFPHIVDARLTKSYDDALGRFLLERFGSSAPSLPEPGLAAYKYLVSIDGAAAAWRRVPIILSLGSVLLLQHEWNQFFYPGLMPWIHYVPLRKDLDDLVEKYGWLESHPAEAEAIASSGRAFALRFLTPEAIERHFLDILYGLSISVAV